MWRGIFSVLVHITFSVLWSWCYDGFVFCHLAIIYSLLISINHKEIQWWYMSNLKKNTNDLYMQYSGFGLSTFIIASMIWYITLCTYTLIHYNKIFHFSYNKIVFCINNGVFLALTHQDMPLSHSRIDFDHPHHISVEKNVKIQIYAHVSSDISSIIMIKCWMYDRK